MESARWGVQRSQLVWPLKLLATVAKLLVVPSRLQVHHQRMHLLPSSLEDR